MDVSLSGATFPTRVSALLLTLSLLLHACGGGAEAQQPTQAPLIAEGKQLFEIHCAACHSTITDTVIVGPPLTGLAERASEQIEGLDARAYLQQSILQPDAYLVEGYKDLMPRNFAAILDDQQIEALGEYLLTLE